MKIKEIETPALIVDVHTLNENINMMQEALKEKNTKLRPHFKTSKCTYIAKKQMEAGAKGITCSKLSEAEVLVNAGIKDILIANQIVQKSKMMRVAFLAKKSYLTVCVDNAENVKQFAKAAECAGSKIHVYIEYDLGMGRCGVSTREEILELALLIMSFPSLDFAGIQCYAGHLSHMEDSKLRREKVTENEQILLEVKEYLKENGVEVRQISGGSTATAFWKAQDGVYTEIQSGSYLFMDSSYEPCNLPFKQSLYLLATVISKKADRIILDAGIKSMGVDQNSPIVDKYPSNELRFSEEHLGVYGSDLKEEIGEQVRIIPGHCCSTINLFDFLYLIDGEEVVTQIPIEGRGRSV